MTATTLDTRAAVPQSSEKRALERSPQTLDGLLWWSVQQYAGQPAVGWRPDLRTESWSYRRLWETSGKIASFLRLQGVTRGDRVVLWAPNSPWWVASFFGIVRLGAVVLPLDIHSSWELAERIIARAEPSFALLSGPAVDTWQGDMAHAGLEGLEALLADLPVLDDVVTEPDDLAELMFTSGTTGDPKGVMLTHRNIVFDVEGCYQTLPSEPHHRLLSLLPLSHMFEQTIGLLLPLRGGASIFYASSRAPARIFKDLHREEITNMLLVPQVLALFMEGIESEVRRQGREKSWRRLQRVAQHVPLGVRKLLFHSVHRRLGGHLEFFVVGGALLEPDLERRWELLGVPVLQGYGMTETAPAVASTSLEDRHPLSVGKALPGVEVRLASDGEILVRGPNVSPGYWRAPERTAESRQGDWFKTGDLGELDAEGRLYIRGRKKALIVLANGLNVFPEDVERALSHIDGVRDSVVLGLPGKGGPRIHAVLLLGEHAPDPADIVRRANAELAGYQRIETFSVWAGDDFPRVHTLKIKRHEVLAVELGEAPKTQSAAAPAAPAKDGAKDLLPFVVAAADCEATAIGPATTLEDAGFDSLGRAELLTAIENHYGVSLDESQIGPTTTISELERLMASGRSGPVLTFSRWPVSRIAMLIRTVLQPPLLRALGLVAPVRVVGRERLSAVTGPAIFVGNHSSHLDTSIVLRALTPTWRKRLAVAAAEDYFFRSRLLGSLAALLFNAFPFSRKGAVRATLDHAAWLMDRGWSILLFPEGTRSVTGRMGPFKRGVGLLATELGVPVIPVWIEGTGRVLPKGRAVPRPATVTVRFGDALRFPLGTTCSDAVEVVEAAVRSLGQPEGGQETRAEAATDRQKLSARSSVPPPRATASPPSRGLRSGRKSSSVPRIRGG